MGTLVGIILSALLTAFRRHFAQQFTAHFSDLFMAVRLEELGGGGDAESMIETNVKYISWYEYLCQSGWPAIWPLMEHTPCGQNA